MNRACGLVIVAFLLVPETFAAGGRKVILMIADGAGVNA